MMVEASFESVRSSTLKPQKGPSSEARVRLAAGVTRMKRVILEHLLIGREQKTAR